MMPTSPPLLPFVYWTPQMILNTNNVINARILKMQKRNKFNINSNEKGKKEEDWMPIECLSNKIYQFVERDSLKMFAIEWHRGDDIARVHTYAHEHLHYTRVPIELNSARLWKPVINLCFGRRGENDFFFGFEFVWLWLIRLNFHPDISFYTVSFCDTFCRLLVVPLQIHRPNCGLHVFTYVIRSVSFTYVIVKGCISFVLLLWSCTWKSQHNHIIIMIKERAVQLHSVSFWSRMGNALVHPTWNYIKLFVFIWVNFLKSTIFLVRCFILTNRYCRVCLRVSIYFKWSYLKMDKIWWKSEMKTCFFLWNV